MLNNSQKQFVDYLKEHYGLSNYEALQILMEKEKAEALKGIATLMMGGSVAGAMSNFFPKDLTNATGDVGNMLAKLMESFFRTPETPKKPSDRDDD